MKKREKRLKNMIESLREGKKNHEIRKKIAEEEGDIQLSGYLGKEIINYENQLNDKLAKLHRKDKNYKSDKSNEIEDEKEEI